MESWQPFENKSRDVNHVCVTENLCTVFPLNLTEAGRRYGTEKNVEKLRQ
jgi:hypothetical protein